MAKEKYYSEEQLVDKMQSGEISWLEYVNHHSRRMKKEYARWCAAQGKTPCDDTAEEFLDKKSIEMEEAMERGDM